MSTEIITIQGQHEVDIDAQEKLVGYEPAELTVETFAGGVRGKMFRINTHQRGDGTFTSIQLTRDQVEELFKALWYELTHSFTPPGE